MMVRGPDARRLSVVDLPVLAASSLYVKGVAVPRFYMAWTLEGGVTAELAAAPEQEGVPYSLVIRTPGGGIEELAGVLEVSWSRTGRSGRRAWLHCGVRGCRYRTDRLYLVGRRLCCRHCSGVQYAQQEPTGTPPRAREGRSTATSPRR